MNQREAKRLALLVILIEVEGSINASDEWVRHPETDDEFTYGDVQKIKAEAQKIADQIEVRAGKLVPR